MFFRACFRKLNETLNVVCKSVAEQSMINSTKYAKIISNVGMAWLTTGAFCLCIDFRIVSFTGEIHHPK